MPEPDDLLKTLSQHSSRAMAMAKRVEMLRALALAGDRSEIHIGAQFLILEDQQGVDLEKRDAHIPVALLREALLEAINRDARDLALTMPHVAIAIEGLRKNESER